MKTLQFSTLIHAKRSIVWDVMLEPNSFKVWTGEFAEGSYFEGSWGKGEHIRFLIPDGSGMTSVIAENRLHEFLSIQHVGYVKDGVDDTESEEIRSWAPAFENYTFTDSGTSTALHIDVEVLPEFEAYMLRTWPKALESLKALCESRSGG